MTSRPHQNLAKEQAALHHGINPFTYLSVEIIAETQSI